MKTWQKSYKVFLLFQLANNSLQCDNGMTLKIRKNSILFHFFLHFKVAYIWNYITEMYIYQEMLHASYTISTLQNNFSNNTFHWNILMLTLTRVQTLAWSLFRNNKTRVSKQRIFSRLRFTSLNVLRDEEKCSLRGYESWSMKLYSFI